MAEREEEWRCIVQRRLPAHTDAHLRRPQAFASNSQISPAAQIGSLRLESAASQLPMRGFDQSRVFIHKKR